MASSHLFQNDLPSRQNKRNRRRNFLTLVGRKNFTSNSKSPRVLKQTQRHSVINQFMEIKLERETWDQGGRLHLPHATYSQQSLIHPPTPRALSSSRCWQLTQSSDRTPLEVNPGARMPLIHICVCTLPALSRGGAGSARPRSVWSSEPWRMGTRRRSIPLSKRAHLSLRMT